MSQVRRIERSSKSVEVRNHCDVLVIGAGPAGFGAAVTAARRGRKVTLVEYGCKLGGMWTLGLLSPFFDNRHHDGLNVNCGAICRQRSEGPLGVIVGQVLGPTEMTVAA